MKIHANARLSPNGRRLLIDRIESGSWTVQAASEAAGISERTARKWLARWRAEGQLGLLDRSSAPKTIANRTGVSVAELIAANPGMKEPKGKVFVPVSGNKVNTIAYSRPANLPVSPVGTSVKVVKAQAGDTVAKVAARNGADATEVAKYNGLLPNSVLGAGREIKIPGK